MTDDEILLASDLYSHHGLNEFMTYEQAMCQCHDVCRCPGMTDDRGGPMRTEPAVIGAAVAAALNLVVLLLLNHELSNDVQTAIVGVVTLLGGLYVRSRVTPVP